MLVHAVDARVDGS